MLTLRSVALLTQDTLSSLTGEALFLSIDIFRVELYSQSPPLLFFTNLKLLFF